MVEGVLGAGAARTRLAERAVADLLGHYGIGLWPTLEVHTVDDALSAAARLGYPVALSVNAEGFRHRVDLGGVRLDLVSEADVRIAFATMRERLPDASGSLVVAPMAQPGVATVVGAQEDEAFGSLVSFGVAAPRHRSP